MIFYNLIEIILWRTKLSSWWWQTGRSGWYSRGWCCTPQRLHRLEEWADRSFIKFSKERCKILHLGRNDPLHQCMLGPPSRHWSFSEKDRGVLVESKWNTSHQCVSSLQRRPKVTLGCTRQSVASELREMILPFSTAVATPRVLCPVQAPQQRWIWTCWRESKKWLGRWLRDWGISVLRKDWESRDCLGCRKHSLRGISSNVEKYLKGGCKEDRSRLSSEVPSDRTRSNRHNTSGTTHETQAVPSEHRKLFNCWGWLSTEKGCPEILWSFHPWRY